MNDMKTIEYETIEITHNLGLSRLVGTAVRFFASFRHGEKILILLPVHELKASSQQKTN
jgi:hypothetical protein